MSTYTPSGLLSGICAEVLEALKMGHKTELRIAKDTGHSEQFILCACRRLKEEGQISLSNKYWELVERTATEDPLGRIFLRPSPERIEATGRIGWFG